MIYLVIVYLIIGFTIIRFMVSLVNFISPITPPLNMQLDEYPLVSVLIPARNEENNINTIINDLLNQDYKNIEIIIYDDESDDKTEQIVKKYTNNYHNIKLIRGNNLPEGWLGKTHACFNLSKNAKGAYLLFLDADIRISDNIIENSIAYLKKQNLTLLSIFPKQDMYNIGEKLTVPIMNWILLSLLPMILIKNCTWKSFSAANGQFMLFKATYYKKHNWHKIVKNEKVEDIKILKLMKKNKLKVHTMLGDNRIRCRMYSNYKQGIDGFSKNVPAFFSNNIFFMLFFIFSTILGIFILLFYNYNLITFAFICLSLLIHILISIKSKQNLFTNLLYLVPRQLSFGIIAFYSLYYKISKTGTWKGRSIY